MNPYRGYRKPGTSTGWTRIEMLLALYDGALERLDLAEAALKAGDKKNAIPLMARTQLIVSALAAGVRPGVNEEMSTNMLRLYDFVVRQLTEPELQRIVDARKILRNLRQGFEAIREEANLLERTGQIPPVEQMQLILTNA
jgi:flagellar biosynthetic protein FliS